jgi:hypothetical protein
VHEDAYATKMHLENLWKPHYHISFTWAFV